MITRLDSQAIQGRLDLFAPTRVEAKSTRLPREVKHVLVPPIKCQGIKTKLVPFILSSVNWSGEGRWIEPFVGSGVVFLNVSPAKAILTDSNVHVIRFYSDLTHGSVNPLSVLDYLKREGALLAHYGAAHYYEVRERFNNNPNSLDFLFLNRSCFNGVIRFNKKGLFNVPFGKKPERFRQAYITKIVNQVRHAANAIEGRDIEFREGDWRITLGDVGPKDFVYADPPYMGRHTDYFNQWSEEDQKDLLQILRGLPCAFALSTWKENKYRQNPYLAESVQDLEIRTAEHFYHVGSKETLRNAMVEALVIKKGFAAPSGIRPGSMPYPPA